MITRREFGRLGVGVIALAKISPLSLFSDGDAQNQSVSGEGASIRRVGVRSNAAYWGHGSEKIDLLSGNLSYSIPLIRAQSRGARAIVRLSYNSQIWKQGIDGPKSYGVDAGAGYGWRLQIASIVPENKGGKVSGYMYVTSTGSEYRLLKNGDNWVSIDGRYITWNPTQSVLWFANGASLTFDCVAGPQEQDAGTLYPTLIQDRNGNQILVNYLPGIGQSGNNSSGRISQIQDARSGYTGSGQYSYLFMYSSGRAPNLLSISNAVGSAEGYSFSYISQRISSPFSQDASGTHFASVLQEINCASGLQHNFEYNVYGELTQAQQPLGGILTWEYQTLNYQDGQSVRQVSSRALSDPYSPSNSHTHSFERDTSDGGAVANSVLVTGPSGSAHKRWTFSSVTGSPNLGLVSKVEEMSGEAVLRQRSLAWNRTASGIPYISNHTIILDPGTANQQTASHQITRDTFGNVTSLAEFDYGSTGSPFRITTHSYLTSQEYLDHHILDRRLTTTILGSGGAVQVRSNQYDTTPIADRSGLTNHNSASFNAGNNLRGNVTEAYVGGVYRRTQYDVTGLPVSIQDSAGRQISIIPAEGTNNTLPGMVLPNGNENLAVQVQYQAGKPSVVTRPNGARTSVSYDALGRKTQIVPPTGAATSISYSTGPYSSTTSTNGRWKKVSRDGFGHIQTVEAGDESGVKAYVQKNHGPAANAPVGKLIRHSLPCAAGSDPQWISSNYDDLGRKTSQDLASTGAPKKISYAGNAVEVTDPAGRWKKIVHNVHGKITKVVMPDANGSSQLETLYSYNALNKLTGVSMPRANGTQTRRFAYDAGGRIVMRHHAESGKQTRTYNPDGTLASHIDAKGQSHVYTRDSYKRITSIKRTDANGSLQPNDSYIYHYDTNPFDSGFSQNAQGRLAAVQWGSPSTLPGLFTEMYSYTTSGQLAAKRLRLNRGNNDADLDMRLSYDDEGRVASIQYPVGGPSLAYSYDSMGRLNGILSTTNSIVKDAKYNAVGQLTEMKLLASNEGQYLAQGYSYNSRNLLTRIVAAPEDSAETTGQLPSLDLEYSYQSNDGKLLVEIDNITGKAVSYKYDNHGRLAVAESSDSSWGLSFGYDGFGNRVSQNVTKGQGYSQNAQHDPATNWMMSNDTDYDANGNIVRLPEMLLSYDAQNRLIQTSNIITGSEAYGYDHKNLRIWKRAASGREIMSFYEGTKRLATYNLNTDASGNISLQLRESNIFFGKKMVQSGGEVVVTDRLGATRAWSAKRGAGSTKYLPFGEEIQRTSNDAPKFGGYDRSVVSGLDYAEQRYYSSTLGRFITPDPYEKSAHVGNPNSWNRYSFVGNDPVNKVDPHGLNDTSYTYYPDGVISSTSYTSSDGMQVTEYYDEDGNPTSEILTDGTNTFTVDFTTADDNSVNDNGESFGQEATDFANEVYEDMDDTGLDEILSDVSEWLDSKGFGNLSDDAATASEAWSIVEAIALAASLL